MMRQSKCSPLQPPRPASKTIISRDFFALPKLRLILSERTSFESVRFVEPYNRCTKLLVFKPQLLLNRLPSMERSSSLSLSVDRRDRLERESSTGPWY